MLYFVYIHSELNPAELRKRIIASVVNVDPQGQLIHVRDIRAHLIEESGQQFIVETLEKHKPDVLVLDVWQDLISGFDENSGKDTSLARSFMSSLIDSFKLTLFLVMHEGKDGSRGGRGHSGMAGWRDTLITLNRHGKSRRPRHRRTTLGRTGDSRTDVERWNHAADVDLQTPQQQTLVNLLMSEYPDGAAPKQIAAGIGVKLPAAYKAIQKAVKDGSVIKTDGGLVCLVSTKKGESPMTFLERLDYAKKLWAIVLPTTPVPPQPTLVGWLAVYSDPSSNR